MKNLAIHFTTIFALFALTSATVCAQAGYYKTEQKTGGESLELLEDNRFNYTFETAWSKSTTVGRWKIEGGKLILHSDKQLEFTVFEEKDPKDEGLCINIIANSADEGPKLIDRILFGEKKPFKKDNSRSLAYLEQYNRIASSGTPAQRDSLKRAYTPQYFSYNAYEGTADTVRLLFDRKEVVYILKDKTANLLIFDFKLDANSLFRYFKNEAWEFVGRKEIHSPEGKIFKKGKK
jgi:hypothetical protein